MNVGQRTTMAGVDTIAVLCVLTEHRIIDHVEVPPTSPRLSPMLSK